MNPQHPSRTYAVSKFLGALMFIGLASLIWRPLGGFLAILCTGYIARMIRRSQELPFWLPGVAIVVGILWGSLVAVLARFLVFWGVLDIGGRDFAFFPGILAVLYVGYDLYWKIGPEMAKEDQNLLLVQVTGFLTYGVVSIVSVFALRCL